MRRPYLQFLIVFAVARAILWLAGLRYSTEHVDSIMHFVDHDLWSERFAETLLYMHGQPPLLPVIVGALANLFGDGYGLALQVLFVAMNCAAGLLMVSSLLACRVGERAATIAACVFCLLPATLVYEHYCFAPVPVTFLSALFVWFLVRAEATRSAPALFGSLLSAALLTNLKSLFHLLWFVGVLLIVWRTFRIAPRRLALVAAVPLLLTLAWPTKNYIVHDQFAASTWMGFGLARKTYHNAPLAARAILVQQGELDAIAAVDLFGDVQAFRAVLDPGPDTGVALLDREQRAAGDANFNHRIYLQATKRMRKEAMRLIIKHPDFYLTNVWNTVQQSFESAAIWAPVATPRRQLGWWGSVDTALHGRWGGVRGLCAWTLLYVVALGVGGLALCRALFRGRDGVRALVCFTILWVFAVAVFFDTNETMRHRYLTDWLVVFLVTVGLCSRRGDAS